VEKRQSPAQAVLDYSSQSVVSIVYREKAIMLSVLVPELQSIWLLYIKPSFSGRQSEFKSIQINFVSILNLKSITICVLGYEVFLV
jgi:hypothetical protein